MHISGVASVSTISQVPWQLSLGAQATQYAAPHLMHVSKAAFVSTALQVLWQLLLDAQSTK